MKSSLTNLNYSIITIIILMLGSCQSNSKSPFEKVEKFNMDLNDFSQKSVTSPSSNKIDEINREFAEDELNELSMTDFRALKNTEEFEELLAREEVFLLNWKPIINFPIYSSKSKDTIANLIKRCATFDTGGPKTLRTPAFGRMNLISLRYYKYEIPVAFHIITMSNGVGVLPNMQKKFEDQIAILNAVYAKFNVSFKLASIDKSVNNVWHTRACKYTDPVALKSMTDALSIHPDKTLNVYTTGITLLGEASFPWDNQRNASKGDYIVINYQSLPGGPSDFSLGYYTQGKTLVHEAGHYMGLYHTFEGGDYDCKDPSNDGCGIGDQVDDTPAQRICHYFGCELDDNGNEQNSCPEPGKDPVRNYMGYNPDGCMNELTNGQVKRILETLYFYRPYFRKTVV